VTISAIKSILAGVGGTFVLAAFCTTFIAIEKVLFIMPLFIAFNGTMTGFRVVEALQDRIRNFTLFSFVMGAGSGAATFSVIDLTGRMMNNPFGLTFMDLGLYIVVSGVTSYLGAKLAARYFNL
jgi:hypothetical protein